MTDSLFRAQRRGNILFGIGWFLVLVNLAGIAWAIAVPILLRAKTMDVFFTFDEALPYALWCVIGVAASAIIALAQIIFLHRLAALMVEDIPESMAAEAALRLARYVAFFTFVLSTASLLWDLKQYRSWVDFSRSGLNA